MRRLVLFLVLAPIFAVACNNPPPPTTAPARPAMTRDEFRTKVMGKTTDEVRSAIGRPDRTTESGERITWIYYGMSIDPETSKEDVSAWVIFSHGKVSEILWSVN